MTASHPIRVLLSVCLALWLSMTVAAQEASTITIDSLSGTQWQFVASTSQTLETPALLDGNVTLAFNETVITGSSGCNTYNGSYMLSDIFTITVGPLATTRRACTSDALMQQEQFYLEALQAASSITRSGDMLTIQDNAGHSLIFLRIIPLEEAEWQLTAYGTRGAEKTVIEDATDHTGL